MPRLPLRAAILLILVAFGPESFAIRARICPALESVDKAAFVAPDVIALTGAKYVRELDPNAVKLGQEPSYIGQHQPHWYPLSKFVSDLTSVKKAAEARLGKGALDRPKRVLMPMAGTDMITPLVLFPEADIYAFDNHPFLLYDHLNGKKKEIEYLGAAVGNERLPDWIKEDPKPFRKSTTVDHDLYAAARLIGTLKEHGMRIRRIVAFGSHEEKPADYVSHKADSWKQGNVPEIPGVNAPVNGFIEFDAGEGTPVRRYYHLQAALPYKESGRGYQERPWYPVFKAVNPDAVVIKAAAGTIEAGNVSSDFRAEILAALRRSQGLMVEGDGRFQFTSVGSRQIVPPLKYEFSGRRQFVGTRQIRVNGNYGYGKTVQFTQFDSGDDTDPN